MFCVWCVTRDVGGRTYIKVELMLPIICAPIRNLALADNFVEIRAGLPAGGLGPSYVHFAECFHEYCLQSLTCICHVHVTP